MTPGSRARAKTDKLDARALAGLLWRGELEAVWMPDERVRVLRRRLARREQLVRGRSRANNEVHAVLVRRLQGRPPCSDLFGIKGRAWLADLELPVEERETVDAGIRQITFLDSELDAVEKLIAKQALSWPEIRRLMTVPGVNLISEASFIAAIGDPKRFMTSRKLVAYLGLDPKVRQSGQGARTQRPDLQTRQRLGALGARRGRVERGASARPVALVLSAHQGQARARQGDRRDCPQARGAVLVHAHPPRGLRPPATLADPPEAQAAGDHRWRAEVHTPRRGPLGHEHADARG